MMSTKPRTVHMHGSVILTDCSVIIKQQLMKDLH